MRQFTPALSIQRGTQLATLAAVAPLPPATKIREVAKEVLTRPYYDLQSGRNDTGEPLFLQILRWVLKPFLWLFKSLEGLPEVLRWVIVIGCAILFIALVAHILYTLLSAIRGPVSHRKSWSGSKIVEADPVDYEVEAELASQKQDYIGAVRLLFRATLRRLELFEKKKFRPGITNRELLNRYRASPVADSIARFVSTIDWKWYGPQPCAQTDYVSCRNEHARICQYIARSQPADRA